LLRTAKETSDRFHPLYYLAIHTGMRQSELIGLKWDDINWKFRTIQVKRQVRHFRGGSYTFTDVKSKSGRRTIILSRNLINIVQSVTARRLEADAAVSLIPGDCFGRWEALPRNDMLDCTKFEYFIY